MTNEIQPAASEETGGDKRAQAVARIIGSRHLSDLSPDLRSAISFAIKIPEAVSDPSSPMEFIATNYGKALGASFRGDIEEREQNIKYIAQMIRAITGIDEDSAFIRRKPFERGHVTSLHELIEGVSNMECELIDMELIDPTDAVFFGIDLREKTTSLWELYEAIDELNKFVWGINETS